MAETNSSKLGKIPIAILVTTLALLPVPCAAAFRAASAAQGEVVHSVSPGGEDVLDNGLVRLAFDRQTGLFVAHGLQGEMMRLFQAGPAAVINDHKIAGREAVKITTRDESFADKLGRGEKLIADYQFSPGTPSFRYELCVYQDKPWISAIAHLPPGDYRLGDFFLVEGKLKVLQAFSTKVYYNPGTTGFNPGVWPLGISR